MSDKAEEYLKTINIPNEIQCDHEEGGIVIYHMPKILQSYSDHSLREVLNKALIGKNRIKGIPSSNKIEEWIQNHSK